MKKRIFTLLLAVCLIAGMLPVIASAEAGNQAYFQLPGVDDKGESAAITVIMDEGAATKYFTTNDAGVVKEDGSADNYNIKIEYAAGGVPTVYLKGAYIYTATMNALQIGRLASTGVDPILDFSAVINVESDSTLIGSGDFDKNAFQSAIGAYATETTTITGAGKLTLKSEENTVVHAFCDLIFKNITVDISSDMTRSGNRSAIHVEKNGDVTFDNTVATIYANTGACIWVHESYWQENDPEQRNIIIKNGSKLTMSNDVQAVPLMSTKGQIVIDNSDVEITAFGVCFNPLPTMTNVTAVGGDKKSKAKAYDEKKAKKYAYFMATATAGGATTPDATEPAAPDATQPTTPNATQPTTPNATQPNATQPAKPDTSNPTTGDNFNIVLLTALLLASAAGVVVIGKKKFSV